MNNPAAPVGVTCKLCGWHPTSNDFMVFTPQVLDHFRTEHPAQWTELQTIMRKHREANHRQM